MQQRKEHAVGILAGAGPATEAKQRGRFRSRLGALEIGRHVGHRDLHVEAGFGQHLLDRLHDALVEDGGGREIDLGLAGGASLRDQRLCLGEVVFRRLDAVDPAEDRWRQQLGHRLVVATEQPVYHCLLVERIGGSETQLGIVEGRLGGVEADISDALGQTDQSLRLGRGLELAGLVGVKRDDEVAGAGLQIGKPGRGIRHGAEDDGGEGRLGTPIGVVAAELHLHAALPGIEFVRAAANRLEVEGVLADRLDHGLGNDGELHQLGQKSRIGTCCRQLHPRG